MSARNMVRNLRESGELETKPTAPSLGSRIIPVVTALALGALVYLGASAGLPELQRMTAAPPPVVDYARPG